MGVKIEEKIEENGGHLEWSQGVQRIKVIFSCNDVITA